MLHLYTFAFMKQYCKKKYLFTLLFFIFYAASTVAQNKACDCNLQGYILDEDGRPIAGAVLFVPALNLNLVSDSSGFYHIQRLCPHSYLIEVKYVGYGDVKQKVTISTSNQKQNFQLSDAQINLEEITVSSEKIPDAFQQNISKTQISRQASKTLAESLQEVSGVNMLQTGSSIAKPTIQGMHSQRIMILNNGVRQSGQNWGVEHAPEIDPLLASNLQVIKGASAIEYGHSVVGGVILVNPPKLNPKKALSGNVRLSASSNGRGGSFSGQLQGNFPKIEGLAWRVQGTLKQFGDFETPSYVLSNTGLRESNFSAALAYAHKNKGLEVFFSRFETELGILASAHIGNTTDLKNAISRQEPFIVRDFTYEIQNPRQDVRHNLLKINSFWELEKGRLNLEYAWQSNLRQEFDIRRGGRSSRPALLLELATHTLDFNFEHQLAQNFQGKVGVQTTFKDNFNDVATTGTRRLIPDYDSQDIGIFVIEKFIQSKWQIEAGLRYDFQNLQVFTFDEDNQLLKPIYQFHNLSGNLGLSLDVGSKNTFSSNIGFTRRPPNINELYSDGLHHGSAAIEEGSTALQSESALKWVGEWRFQSDKFSFSLSPYLHYIQNFIYLNPSEIRLTIRGAFPVYTYTPTDARFLGLDFESQYNFHKNISAEIRGSFLQVEDLRFHQKLPWIQPNQMRYHLKYNLVSRKKVENFYLNLGILQAFRQNRAPEALQDLDNIPENALENFDFAAAPAGYWLWNFGAGIDLKLKHKQQLGFYLNIENLLNTQYRNYMNRFRYFADELGRNFNLNIHYKF